MHEEFEESRGGGALGGMVTVFAGGTVECRASWEAGGLMFKGLFVDLEIVGAKLVGAGRVKKEVSAAGPTFRVGIGSPLCVPSASSVV